MLVLLLLLLFVFMCVVNGDAVDIRVCCVNAVIVNTAGFVVAMVSPIVFHIVMTIYGMVI